MSACINLRDRFGDRFRVSHEESYAAERSEFRSAEEPWLQIIHCRHGHIVPWGGDLLAVSTNRRGPLAARIRTLPGLEVVQDGSDGLTATFTADRFDEVADIMGAKRRRRLSPEQRAAAVERLRRFQYPAASKRSPSGQERARTGQDDSQAANAGAKNEGPTYKQGGLPLLRLTARPKVSRAN